MNLTSLFTALRLGALELPHRIVLALLTRMRAGAGGVPTAMNATYSAACCSGFDHHRGDVRRSTRCRISQCSEHFFGGADCWLELVTECRPHSWRQNRAADRANGRMSHSAYMPDRSVPVAPLGYHFHPRASVYSGRPVGSLRDAEGNL